MRALSTHFSDKNLLQRFPTRPRSFLLRKGRLLRLIPRHFRLSHYQAVHHCLKDRSTELRQSVRLRAQIHSAQSASCSPQVGSVLQRRAIVSNSRLRIFARCIANFVFATAANEYVRAGSFPAASPARPLPAIRISRRHTRLVRRVFERFRPPRGGGDRRRSVGSANKMCRISGRRALLILRQERRRVEPGP